MQRLHERTGIRIIAVAVLVIASYVPILAPAAFATSAFKEAFVRFDRMASGQTTGGVICAKANTVGTEKGLKVTFPNTVSLSGAPVLTGSTASINDYYPIGSPGTPTVWPGLGASTITQSGQVVTVSFVTTGGDLNNTALYCFTFSAVATLGSAGSGTSPYAGKIITYNDNTTMNATTQMDETDYGITIVGAGPDQDQIVVTAVVPPLFDFALGANVDTFGDLDPTTVKASGGVTATVITNAKGGWIAWAKDANAGLHSASASYTIASPGTAAVSGAGFLLTSGTQIGYLLNVAVSGSGTGPCTVNPDAAYLGAGNHGGALATTFNEIASCTGAPPATSSNDQITLKEYAAITSATPAGTDYTDTITVVGAGNF